MNEKSNELETGIQWSAENTAPRPASRNPTTFKSVEMFAGAREVFIEHEGYQYRLRHTSKGKLILTK